MRSWESSSSPIAWKDGSSTDARALRILIDFRTYCWNLDGRKGGANWLIDRSAIEASRSGWIRTSCASAPNLRTWRVSSHSKADGLTFTNMAARPWPKREEFRFLKELWIKLPYQKKSVVKFVWALIHDKVSLLCWRSFVDCSAWRRYNGQESITRCWCFQLLSGVHPCFAFW